MKKVTAVLIGIMLLAGCTKMGSMMLIGGSAVNPDYRPDKILITYSPLGNFEKDTNFLLVEHRGRIAMLKQDESGGILMEKHWVEDDKDYFSAAFFGSGDAYIVFVPADRSKEGGYYAYPHGSYQGTPGDRKRPMPYTPKTEPDARLIPQK